MTLSKQWNMKPPNEITSEILKLISSISEKLGENKSPKIMKPPTELLKRNRINQFKLHLKLSEMRLPLSKLQI